LLQRNFHFFSIFGYAVILGATWEFALMYGLLVELEVEDHVANHWSNSTGTLSLTNGGTAGAIWIFLVVCFGMFFVMLSMAEMASM
jgi:choline transport protein